MLRALASYSTLRMRLFSAKGYATLMTLPDGCAVQQPVTLFLHLKSSSPRTAMQVLELREVRLG